MGFYASLRDNHEKPLWEGRRYLTKARGWNVKGSPTGARCREESHGRGHGEARDSLGSPAMGKHL